MLLSAATTSIWRISIYLGSSRPSACFSPASREVCLSERSRIRFKEHPPLCMGSVSAYMANDSSPVVLLLGVPEGYAPERDALQDNCTFTRQNRCLS